MHQRSSMVLFLVGVGCWIGMGMNDVATWYKIHIKQYGKKYVTLISVIYYIQTTTTKYSNNEIYIEILIFGASAVHSASPWASMAECLYSNLRETPTTRRPAPMKTLDRNLETRILYDITGCWCVGNSRKNIYKKNPKNNVCTYQSHVMITYNSSPKSHWVFRRKLALSKFQTITLSDVLFPGISGGPFSPRKRLHNRSSRVNHATLAHSLEKL